MKALTSIMALLVVISLAYAEKKAPAKIDNSPETVALRVAAFNAYIQEQMGGYIEKPAAKLGKVSFVNAQHHVPFSVVKDAAELYANLLHVRIEAVEGEQVSVRNAKDTKAKLGANAVIFVTEDKELTTPTIVAPDGLWALVNVAALAEDNVKESVLKARTTKEIGRAFAMTCGAASSQYQGSVLAPMPTLDHIDLYNSIQIPADAIMRMQPYLKEIGVLENAPTTYLDACNEGWAPAPTNDVQRGIWEKVHAPPSKPIKISYDKDKQKPVVK